MLHINDPIYRVGGRVILDGGSVHIPAGHKVGIVGRNGAGKSTLLRLVLGELSPDGGEIRLSGRARAGMVAQEAPGGDGRLIDFVLAADRERARLLAEAETASDPARVAEIHTRLADIGAHAAEARAARILAGLGFDEAAQQRPLSSFSGGWRMRVALAAMLFAAPDLLLLDEPTNYLDLEGALWLESYLRGYPHTVLLVSHDRDLLNNAVGSILHIDNGRLALYRGGYDEFERVRREQQALQDKLRAKQEDERKRMQAFVDRFRYKASKARQAQSRLKMLERMQPIAAAAEDPTVTFRFPRPAPLRPPLLAADGAAVGYEPGRPVLRGLDFRLDPDDRIALLGRNGNGKSTLAKLLAGRLSPMQGELRRGDKLKVGFFAQHQIEDLRPQETPVAHLARLLPGRSETELRARLGGFGLVQDKAQTPVEALSGGERARLVLALVTVEAPQLLVLDEPTNHLDVDAREALVQALNDYEGAVVLVSHDRHLIDLVADRLWLVADGTVRPWEGDIDDYRRQLLRRDGGGADRDKAPEEPADRKESRRAGAERRARLQPLRQRLRAAEAEVAKLEERRKRTDAALADPALYDGPAERVADLNRERAELNEAIAKAEARWLEAAQTLEEAEAAAAEDA